MDLGMGGNEGREGYHVRLKQRYVLKFFNGLLLLSIFSRKEGQWCGQKTRGGDEQKNGGLAAPRMALVIVLLSTGDPMLGRGLWVEWGWHKRSSGIASVDLPTC
jgi:hypothetical protein